MPGWDKKSDLTQILTHTYTHICTYIWELMYIQTERLRDRCAFLQPPPPPPSHELKPPAGNWTRIKFKTLMLAYRTATGSAPSYFHSLMTIYIPSRRDLRVSDASWCHHREAQNHSPERFHSPFLAGGMNFPPSSGTMNTWQFSSDTWKLISSVITWLHLKKKKKKKKKTFDPFP